MKARTRKVHKKKKSKLPHLLAMDPDLSLSNYDPVYPILNTLVLCNMFIILYWTWKSKTTLIERSGFRFRNTGCHLLSIFWFYSTYIYIYLYIYIYIYIYLYYYHYVLQYQNDALLNLIENLQSFPHHFWLKTLPGVFGLVESTSLLTVGNSSGLPS